MLMNRRNDFVRMWKGAKKSCWLVSVFKIHCPRLSGGKFFRDSGSLGDPAFFDLQRQVPGGIIQVDVQVFFLAMPMPCSAAIRPPRDFVRENIC